MTSRLQRRLAGTFSARFIRFTWVRSQLLGVSTRVQTGLEEAEDVSEDICVEPTPRRHAEDFDDSVAIGGY